MSKTVIELAKQAGWEYADGDGGFEPLWRFAELVRADERAKLAEQPAPVQQEPITDVQRQEIHNATGAGFALIRLVEIYLKEEAAQNIKGEHMIKDDDTIRMAREAGVSIRGHYDETGSTPQELERLIAFARAAEREACEMAIEELPPDADRGDCAAAIRARGNT